MSVAPNIPLLSIVVPLYNEAENIHPLFAAVEAALPTIHYELVLVDDGSTDGTAAIIKNLGKPNVQLIVFQRNFGQTSALAAGIDAARGTYIATMDGDLQNDPADIPMMLAKLEAEDLDIVAGWRKKRNDKWLRRIPSMAANWLIRTLTHVHIQDSGCTLKLFRASLAKQLDLYGELHRFIPLLGRMYGARIAEVEVRHHARRFGTSKYGLSRTLHVASDILLMSFFLKYRQKPMHLFGTIGLLTLLAGTCIEFYMLALKISGESIGERPLFYVGILLIVMAIQFITAGFVSELTMRTYFESQRKKPYIIRDHITSPVV